MRQLGLHAACLLLVACSNPEPEGSAAGGKASSGAGGANAAGTASTGGTFSGAAGQAGVAPFGGSSAAGGSGSGSGGDGGGGRDGGGATSTCSNSYLLCEDFEGTDVGKTPTGYEARGAVAVADDQANRGKHSLKVSPADNGERRIYHDAAMVGAQHWGRVYYRAQLPVPEAFVHSTLVAFYGKGPSVGDAEFRFVDTVKDAKTGGFAGGKHQFLFNVQPNGAEFGAGTSYDYDFDGEWHCVEWHVDATDQSYHFYYEGKDVLNFTHGAGNFADSELPSGFSELRLGWNNYQSAPPGFTAWLDDFAIDDERVGCLRN
jgi:hypothetical protein